MLYSYYMQRMASTIAMMLKGGHGLPGDMPAQPRFGKKYAASWRAGKAQPSPGVPSRQVSRRMDLVGRKAHFMGQRRVW